VMIVAEPLSPGSSGVTWSTEFTSVEQDQHPAAGHPGAVEAGQLVHAGGNRLMLGPERAEQLAERLGARQRGAGVVAPKPPSEVSNRGR
jgi:hypothetical protein